MFKKTLLKVYHFLLPDIDSIRNKRVIKKIENINHGFSILDAGAGEMKYKKYCKHLKYVSQDFNQYDGKGNNEGLQTKTWDRNTEITSDIINIPVKSGSFDTIMCTEVLEHIPYPEKAVKEFERILKKGGKLILTAPFCSLTHFAPFFYCTGFSRFWYQKVLEDTGFEINEISHYGNYFQFLQSEILRTLYVFKNYGNNLFFIPLSILILCFGVPLVLIFKLCSLFSKKSEDILCFGIMVYATKK